MPTLRGKEGACVMERKEKEVLERFKKNTKIHIQDLTKEIKKFELEFKENPARALDWSLSMFDIVAKREVAEQALRILGNDLVGFQKLNRHLYEMVLIGSKCPYRSTSPTGNLWEVSLLKARATMLDSLRYLDISEKGDTK